MEVRELHIENHSTTTYIIGMSLTQEDMKQLQTMMQDTVVDVIETLVFPKFDQIDERLGGVNERLDAIDARLDSADGKFVSLTARLDSINHKLNAHDVKFREIHNELRIVNSRLDSIDGRLEALENDVKDLYHLTMAKDSTPMVAKSFSKLSAKDKLLIMNAELLAMAKKECIILPR